jgi:hypothetical protein
MSDPKKPSPAKLLIGVFMKEKKVFVEVLNRLQSLFGDVDIISAWFDFDFTKYYEPEMGSPLFRRIIVFKNLIRQDALSEIKLKTNEIEKEFSFETDQSGQRGKRAINIDPGYMLRERFVLATGKNFAHRIYIGNKIYADLTFIFHKGAFKTLPWTYPDYAADNMIEFLKKVRAKYVRDLTILTY